MFEDEIRFLKVLSRIDFGDYGDSCWLWTGAFNRRYGYGYWYARVKGTDKVKGDLAHRLVWRLVVGDIPEGLTLDHLCETKLCVNPDHLEVVTRAENTRRGSHRRTSPVVTHCKHGHEFTTENTYIRTNGRRACKECNRLAARAHQSLLRATEPDKLNAYQREWRAKNREHVNAYARERHARLKTEATPRSVTR